MNLDDKLKYAEEYLKAKNLGQSKDFIRQELSKSKLSKKEINTIEKSAFKIIYEDYGKKVKQYLLHENLENHLEEFDLIDADQFENLQREQLSKIIAESTEKVNTLAKESVPLNGIIEQVSNAYFTSFDVESRFNEIQNTLLGYKKDLWLEFLIFIFVIIIAFLALTFTIYFSNDATIYFSIILLLLSLVYRVLTSLRE